MQTTFLTFFLLVVFSIVGKSQNLVRQELTKDELKYLTTDIVDGFSSPKIKDFENSVRNNLVNYEFEILYNNQPIYRGVVNKPSIAGIDFHGRNKVSFCFEYDIFDAETKLELAEGKRLKLSTTNEGKKYLWADRYELFSTEGFDKDLKLNDVIAKSIRIKFYKIIYSS